MQELRRILKMRRVVASMTKDGLPVENLQRFLGYAGSRTAKSRSIYLIQPLINRIHKPGTRRNVG